MDQLVDRMPGKTSHKAEERGAYSEFLTECRADITQYTIWYKSHTEPLLRHAPKKGLQLLDVDLKAMAELVHTLVRCYERVGQTAEIPILLDRLRSNIDGPRWQRKITYFHALNAALAGGDDDRARSELRKLEPLEEETDVETLQLYLDLCGASLTFSKTQEIVDQILKFTKSDIDRLHYRGVKAMQYFTIGDRLKADQELEGAISNFRSSDGASDTSPYVMDILAMSIEFLGSLRLDSLLLDEAIDLYTKALALDDWTKAGRAKLLRQLGDAYRHKDAWIEAMGAYTHGQETEPSEIVKVFIVQCLLKLEGWQKAALVMDSIDVSALSNAEYTDYVFAVALVAAAGADCKRLHDAERLLRGLDLDIPYFRECREELLLTIIDTQRTGKSDSMIKRAWMVVAGIAATANQYVMLEPNVMGLGLRVNRIIDDITKRSKTNHQT